MSLSTINKTEEILKWRQQQHLFQKNNNGENVTASPILSRNGEFSKAPATGRKMSTTKQQMPKFYITLAKESPQRIVDESDASTYDNSFHCRETDICQDSSDETSSFTTDGIATMEVLEYEVASASDSGEELESNVSSSGTDDFILAAVAASAMCDDSTLCSSDLADTEESDNSDNTYDSELSSADYWVCVKCKNKQNNPMYRYCEKCYQIRKNHFPPRPRRKTRLNRKRKAAATTSSLSHSNRNHIRNSVSPESDRGSCDIYVPPIMKINNNTVVNNVNQQECRTIADDDGGGGGDGNSSDDDDGILKNNINYIKGGSNNNYTNSNKKTILNYSSNINKLNSAVASSSSSSDEDNDDDDVKSPYKNTSKRRKLNLGERKMKNNINFSTKQSSLENMNSINTEISITNSLGINLMNMKRKLPDTTVDDLNESTKKRKLMENNVNSIIASGSSTSSSISIRDINLINNNNNNNNNSDFETDILLNSSKTLTCIQQSQKDSGISSAYSSQDDRRSNKNPIEEEIHLNQCSQETCCEELDEKDIIELTATPRINTYPIIPSLSVSSTETTVMKITTTTRNNDINSENLATTVSELLPISRDSIEENRSSTVLGDGEISLSNHSHSPLIRSVSACSGRYINSLQDSNDIINSSESLKLNNLRKSIENVDNSVYGLCIVCLSAPKNGVFVHSRFLHVCCCYKCAVKIWNRRKRCPICNCTVKNVMKLFVH